MPVIDTFADVDGTLLQLHVPDTDPTFNWTRHPNSILNGLINGNTVDSESNFGRVWYRTNKAKVDAGGAFEVEVDITISDPPVSSQVGIWLIDDVNLFTGYELLINVFTQGVLVELVGLASHSSPENSVTVADFPANQVPVAGTFPLKLRKAGNVITSFWKGVQKHTFINNEYPNIRAVGIRYNGNDGVTFVHNYRITSLSVPAFTPPPFIAVFPDPAIAIYDCIDDSAPEVEFVERFTAADGTLLENYVEPTGGGSWGAGLPDFTPGGIWVVNTNKMREALLNFSFQRPVNELGIAFSTEMEIYCDIESIAASSPSFTWCARRQLNSYNLVVDRVNNRLTCKVLHLGTGAQSSVTHFATTLASFGRYGVTVLDAITGQMQVWSEPYGGGIRTVHGTWTPLTNLFNDVLQDGVGMVTGTAVGNTWDNLSVLSNAISDVGHPTFNESAGSPAVPVYTCPGDP